MRVICVSLDKRLKIFWVAFVEAQSMELAINYTIQLCELRIRIRRKVGGLTRGISLSLQCRYLASVDPFKYMIFDMKGEAKLEAVTS